MTTPLTQGANRPLPDQEALLLTVNWQPARIGGKEVDASAFLLTGVGKVRGDADMIFYNQPASADGSVTTVSPQGGIQSFRFDLPRMAAEVQRIAVTLTIHDAAAVTLAQASRVCVEAATAGDALASYEVELRGRNEAALILVEIYRHAGGWKIRAVGQGFVGGLDPLARAFGIEVSDEPAAATAPSPAAMSSAPPATGPVSLEKRLVDLEKRDPQLVSLVKKLQVCLDKQALLQDTAQVALCLDISGSMHGLYQSGKIDQLVQRIMALGFRFDDEGQIDVFLFGSQEHYFGSLGVEHYRHFVRDLLRRHALEGGTNYGKVIQAIRRHYAARANFGAVPVYVMFVTDGGTGDPALTEQQIIQASHEAIFWQFMAIGPARSGGQKGWLRRLLPSGFDFLAKLDDLPGRAVDNADFFSVADPAQPTDEELFGLLMTEYPNWLRNALAQGILRRA
jgi:stress response protein SCP2